MHSRSCGTAAGTYSTTRCLAGVQVSWDDIGGLDELKADLQQIVAAFTDPTASAGSPVLSVPKGLLLFGAPGCSKTLLARALASEAGVNFLAVKGSELYSKYVGQSEKAVAKLFARARQAAPAIVFFDELDGLTTARSAAGAGALCLRCRPAFQ
jgi:AAA family ATPase